MLTDIYSTAYDRVQSECGAEQREFLRVIAEARDMPLDWLDGTNCMFIPNNEFMLEFFGEHILNYDCYRNGICIWNNALIFPIRDVVDSVVGLAGFFPFDYLDPDVGNYYAYSSQSVFKKGNYLYFPKKNLKDAIHDGYLFITDGMFDAIAISAHGFNAAAMMGSTVTPIILMQLRLVKKVIVVADNDSAGYKLYDRLHRVLSNVLLFKQGFNKDIDGALKSEHKDEVLNMLLQEMEGEHFVRSDYSRVDY